MWVGFCEYRYFYCFSIFSDLENAFVDETNGLVIPSISLEDDAIYVCSASNEAGECKKIQILHSR